MKITVEATEIETIWSRSIREELLGTLKMIAGLLAWQSDLKIIAWIFFALTILDMKSAVVFAWQEVKAMRIKPQGDTRATST